MIRCDRSIHRSTRLLFAALVVTALLAVLPAEAVAVSDQATTYFTFMSRGFGHGIGMSQYGAKGFAEAGYGYEHILRHYYGSSGTDPNTAVTCFTWEPTRDVNLDNDANYNSASAAYNAGFTKASWTVRPGSAGSQLAVYDGVHAPYTYADGWSTFTAEGNRIRLRDPSGAEWMFDGTIAVWGVSGSPRLTQVKEGTGQYDHEFVRFRGELRITANNGKLKLVNRLKMPEYLYGVVPREMPASWHIEALKAQAVAARSYSWTSTRTELYTTTSDQVYGGHSRGEDRANTEPHENSRSNEAVDATLGQALTYGGTTTDKIVRAYFMSTSGGHTENNENVWSGSPQPHLRGVADPYEVKAGSSRHGWKYQSFTAAEVRTKLLSAGAAPALVPDPIADIRVVSRGVSGRPTKVEFTSLTGYKTYFDSYSEILAFRNGLGWGDHWFYVDYKTTRIAGDDRYETSVVASKRIFTAQGSTNPAKAVIVANGAAPADALAASGLAGAVGGAPVLLVKADKLPASVAEEIGRLGVSKVYIAGGEAVVGSAVAEALGDLPKVTSVVRLDGPDRYGTAKQIALEIDRLASPTRVIVVSGESLADAVAAAGFAYARKLPIVPVRADEIPAASQQALDAIDPESSFVIGGPAVVSDAVVNELPGGARKVSGADRYESARALSWHLVKYEGFNMGSAYVASGPSLVDALAIGPVNGHNRNPLLFARPYDLTSPTRLELAGNKATLWRVHIAGGDAALSGWLQGQIEQTLE